MKHVLQIGAERMNIFEIEEEIDSFLKTLDKKDKDIESKVNSFLRENSFFENNNPNHKGSGLVSYIRDSYIRELKGDSLPIGNFDEQSLQEIVNASKDMETKPFSSELRDYISKALSGESI